LMERTEAKELTQAAASEVLGINVRTFQRWAARSSETQQRRRQITSYKNTTTSPATDISEPVDTSCLRW
jgi:hypothetical protein